MIREINAAGIALIKSFEGLGDGDPTTKRLDPYMDPIGVWTIGYGHAIRWRGQLLRGKERAALVKRLYPNGISFEQADALLRADLLDICRDVATAVTVQLADNQFAALVSFTYNLGIKNLKRSSLLRFVNQKQFDEAANEFPKWDKAAGRVLPGLTRRRTAEAALFRGEGLKLLSWS